VAKHGVGEADLATGCVSQLTRNNRALVKKIHVKVDGLSGIRYLLI
jgi:hypothetical protein